MDPHCRVAHALPSVFFLLLVPGPSLSQVTSCFVFNCGPRVSSYGGKPCVSCFVLSVGCRSSYQPPSCPSRPSARVSRQVVSDRRHLRFSFPAFYPHGAHSLARCRLLRPDLTDLILNLLNPCVAERLFRLGCLVVLRVADIYVDDVFLHAMPSMGLWGGCRLLCT